jgi:hypothetical protein
VDAATLSSILRGQQRVKLRNVQCAAGKNLKSRCPDSQLRIGEAKPGILNKHVPAEHALQGRAVFDRSEQEENYLTGFTRFT